MSLHGYTGSSGQVGYIQPSPSYQYPQPSHASLHDPNGFRQFYTAQLTALTFNSRHIIQNLSMIAQESTRMSDIVVQCVESHIRRVQPNIKLPAWYLLDALSKNVPVPYARLFAPVVSDLFLESYRVVDPGTRHKMEEMLWTWRDGGPNGRELFGVGPQESIERSIASQPSRVVHARPASVSTPPPSQISKAQVLSDLEAALIQQERRLQMNPYDNSVSQNIEVLQQLLTVVRTTAVKHHELVAIDKQLRQMHPQPPVPSLSPQHVYPPPPSVYDTHSQPSIRPANIPAPILAPVVEYRTPNPPQYPVTATNAIPPASILSFLQPGATAGPSAPPLGTSSADIANLFNSLVQAGIVSGTPVNTSNTPPAAVGSKSPDSTGVRKKEQMEYESNITSMSISLTTSDISRQQRGIIPFLYQQMPLQCKQCAIRFPDGPTGKKNMEDHLDMHFRQNRKASENIGRGHNRSWFIGLKDWVSANMDTKGKGRADKEKVTAAEEDAKLRQSYVLVPPGDETKIVQCPVCKETLKPEFLEDDEDWAWRNAVRVQGRIYHATCHAETATASSLASRLRNEATAERSRSGTPELNGNRVVSGGTNPLSSLKEEIKRTPTPDTFRLSGTKRKVDEIDRVKTEDSESPPSKKAALSHS